MVVVIVVKRNETNSEHVLECGYDFYAGKIHKYRRGADSDDILKAATRWINTLTKEIHTEEKNTKIEEEWYRTDS